VSPIFLPSAQAGDATTAAAKPKVMSDFAMYEVMAFLPE
jgi:hypothetical protein